MCTRYAVTEQIMKALKMVSEQKNVYMIIKTNQDTNIINRISKLKKKKVFGYILFFLIKRKYFDMLTVVNRRWWG